MPTPRNVLSFASKIPHAGAARSRDNANLIAVQNYQPQLKSRRLQLVCDRMSSVEGFSTASHQLASAKRPCVAICWHCGHLMFKVTQNIIRLIKARLVSYRPSILFVSQIAPLHTMRLSFAMVLPVVAALASLTSASLADADAKPCPIFCRHTRQCSGCPAVDCVSFGGLSPRYNHITHRHCSFFLYAT
ncbi:hypothetical protein P692DRAFT_20138743 [Suillus brevipes Sb2]|nr:hypothetical protein P692DRAFT_20138743 [Suillus brevipes Sb2]